MNTCYYCGTTELDESTLYFNLNGQSEVKVKGYPIPQYIADYLIGGDHGGSVYDGIVLLCRLCCYKIIGELESKLYTDRSEPS